MFILYISLIVMIAPLHAYFRMGEYKFRYEDIESDGSKLHEVFTSFSNHFNKMYFYKGEVEERERIFGQNLRTLEKKYSSKKLNYKVNVNRFSDMTWEEFKKSYLMRNNLRDDFFRFKKENPDGFIKFKSLKLLRGGKAMAEGHPKEVKQSGPKFGSAGNRPANKKLGLLHKADKLTIYQTPETSRLLQAPTNQTEIKVVTQNLVTQTPEEAERAGRLQRKVDWSSHLSKIQDQKRCASCYAFSGMGAFEALYSIRFGKTLDLSEQEILDCSTENFGCDGGNPFRVYKYISRNRIALEKDYPYMGKVGSCKKIPKEKKIKKSISYYFLDPNIFELLEALQEGPVSVIHFVNQAFKHYSSGVFDDNTCRGELNHSSVAVGYDLDAPVPYVLCKNAWADDWGEKGFYKLAIGPLTYTNKGTCMLVEHDMNVAPYF